MERINLSLFINNLTLVCRLWTPCLYICSIRTEFYAQKYELRDVLDVDDRNL